MRKMSIVCVMVMCLAMSGFSSLLSREGYWERLKTHDKKEFDRFQEIFNDPVQLKERFEKNLLVYPHISGKEMIEFKQVFGISDEVMRSILMDIIREVSAKNGWQWENPKFLKEIDIANMQLHWAICWLEVCADADAKQFLMDIATDTKKGDVYRRTAAFTYLRCSNAQETRDALTCFFADDMRAVVCPVYGPYNAAIEAYDKAESDLLKREAIVTSLTAALAKEENEKLFIYADKLLTKRSKAYAESPQRKAALQRFDTPTAKETP